MVKIEHMLPSRPRQGITALERAMLAIPPRHGPTGSLRAVHRRTQVSWSKRL